MHINDVIVTVDLCCAFQNTKLCIRIYVFFKMIMLNLSCFMIHSGRSGDSAGTNRKARSVPAGKRENAGHSIPNRKRRHFVCSFVVCLFCFFICLYIQFCRKKKTTKSCDDVIDYAPIRFPASQRPQLGHVTSRLLEAQGSL